jgi:hypothetical protein
MTAPDAVAAFLASYSPEVRELALRLRELVLAVEPGLIEQVDPPSKLIGYSVGPRMVDTVCTIMPLRAAVNLGIFRGAELPDPAEMLTGTGKVHRHVRIASVEAIANPALRALLQAALAAKSA